MQEFRETFTFDERERILREREQIFSGGRVPGHWHDVPEIFDVIEKLDQDGLYDIDHTRLLVHQGKKFIVAYYHELSIDIVLNHSFTAQLEDGVYQISDFGQRNKYLIIRDGKIEVRKLYPEAISLIKEQGKDLCEIFGVEYKVFCERMGIIEDSDLQIQPEKIKNLDYVFIEMTKHQLPREVLEKVSRARHGESQSHSVETRTEKPEFIVSEARPKLEEICESSNDEPADMPELIRQLNLEAQFGERLTTLKHYGFVAENGEAKEGDVQPPTFEKAMSAFKPGELEIASGFQKPTLLLVPENSFAAKVKALVEYIKEDIWVSEGYKETDSGSEKITGWRAVIVDGAEEMEADWLYLTFEQRIESRKKARKVGEKGMNRHAYMLLLMETIRNGNPIDDKELELYTLLDDDPTFPSYNNDGSYDGSSVPAAGFGFFYGRCLEIGDGRARFRSSVGGDVLLS